MKKSWAQPSLSRDFALLSSAIIFMLVLLSAWIAWVTYAKHSERIIQELQKEAERIDKTLEREIENAGFLLNAIGTQITIENNRDLKNIALILKSFESSGKLFTLWSWADKDMKIVVVSNKGVLNEPVNIADRDYVQKASSDPWQPHIGMPVRGRISDRWIIPIAIGITDSNQRFLGSLVASIDIQNLTEQISHLIRRDGISYAVLNTLLVPLTEVSQDNQFITRYFPENVLNTININDKSRGVATQGGIFNQERIYSYYQVSSRYPYIILVGFDSKQSTDAIRGLLWPRLIQVLALAGFLLLFLWIVRVRIIKPVVSLTEVTADMANGQPFRPAENEGPMEVQNLAEQIKRMGMYVEERKRVEEELREKIYALREKGEE